MPSQSNAQSCWCVSACKRARSLKLSTCNSVYREKTQLTDVEKGSLITNFMSFKFQRQSFQNPISILLAMVHTLWSHWVHCVLFNIFFKTKYYFFCGSSFPFCTYLFFSFVCFIHYFKFIRWILSSHRNLFQFELWKVTLYFVFEAKRSKA